MNADHMQSLESLESMQINLEKNIEQKQKFNQYKQKKVTNAENDKI